jgi:hypothetical protein
LSEQCFSAFGLEVSGGEDSRLTTEIEAIDGLTGGRLALVSMP